MNRIFKKVWNCFSWLLGVLLSFLKENFPKNISFMEWKTAALSAYKTRRILGGNWAPFME